MRLSVVFAFLFACGGNDAEPEPGAELARSTREVNEVAPEPEPSGEAVEATCEERVAELDARVEAVAAAHRACRYDVECIAGFVRTPCYTPCGEPAHPRAVAAFEALSRAIEADACAGYVQAGCQPVEAECARWLPGCRDGACVAVRDTPSADDVPAPIPASNSPSLAEAPPRPPAGTADERAQRLFDAIVHDDPRRAADFFLPREAFLRVKAIADPGGYWDRLYARYEADIHALHESTPDLDRARFERLEIVRRGGWVRVREEGNAVPYWVSRHSWLHYTVDEAPRKIEVRVLITWDDQWWITHLSEFH